MHCALQSDSYAHSAQSTIFKGFQGISKLFHFSGVHKGWKNYLNDMHFKVLKSFL